MGKGQPEIKRIAKCRICSNKKLVPIMSLGEQYVSNFISRKAEHGAKVPLELVLCEPKSGGCGLLQLRHTTPGKMMYEKYWYQSGINESMRTALADIARNVELAIPLRKGDAVLDIGCNDGTLLRSYSAKGIKLIGIDPAKNIVSLAGRGTTMVINDYFSAEAILSRLPAVKFKAITSIAMFYDLDDPNKFVSDIAGVLHPDGLWVIQMSYLPLMLEQNAFDNICHEHLEYYSLTSLASLLRRHGMKVFGVSINEVNGGSFRVLCGFGRNARLGKISGGRERVKAMLDYESALGLGGRAAYLDFAKRVAALKARTVGFIKREKAKGKSIWVYGASTKGNTLLQTYGLSRKLISGAAERNPDKYGKMTVGTLIPIVSEQEARDSKPDYFLMLPWHFIDSFMGREREFLLKGGKFIVPLPEFRIISKRDLA